MVSPSTEDTSTLFADALAQQKADPAAIHADKARVIWSHLSHDSNVSRHAYMDMHGAIIGFDHKAIWSTYARMCEAMGVYEDKDDALDLLVENESDKGVIDKARSEKRMLRKEYKAIEKELSLVIFGI